MLYCTDKVLEFSVLMFISCFAFGRSFKEVAMGLIVICLLIFKINKRQILPGNRLNIPLIIFGITIVVSLLFSMDRVRSMDILNDVVRASIILFGVSSYLKGKKEIGRVLWAFLFMVVLQGIDGTFQYIYGFDFIRGYKLMGTVPGEGNRVTGSFGYWSVGNLLSLTLPFSYAFIEIVKKRRQEILLVLMLLLPILTIILSRTRSSWISFLIFFAIFFLYAEKKRLYIPILIIPVLFVVFGPSSLLDRLNSLARTGGAGRIGIWGTSMEMIKDSPIYGHGPGTFKNLYPDYKKKLPQYKSPGRTPHAHNIYIHTLAEMGIIGLSSLLFLLYSMVSAILSAIKKSRGDPLLYSFSVAVLGSMTVYIIEGFLTHGLFRMWLMQMLALIIGFTIAVSALASGEAGTNCIDSEK